MIVVPPLCLGAAMAGRLSGLYMMSGLMDYVGAYTLGSILWIPSALVSRVPQVFQRVVPALIRVARQQTRFFS